MAKIKCAIVGSGNIGTDLLFKLRQDPYLEVALVVGIDPASEGLAIAKSHGIVTTDQGTDGFVKQHKDIDIVFEATSAAVHKPTRRFTGGWARSPSTSRLRRSVPSLCLM